MYYVVIDISQLYTRLCNSMAGHAVDLENWLQRRGFVQTNEGFYGSAEAMNCLSCSEILFSEWRHPYHASPDDVSGMRGRIAV